MALSRLDTALTTLVIALILARFVGLEHSPPGFFVDEAALAAHATCLGTHGRDGHGQAWPLITPALGGGYATPGLLYSGALLASIVNPTIGVIRLIPALFSALTILAVMALARLWGGRPLALWCGLAAAVSPWAFQFSRIFWDPPLAPCFLMWALYFWFRPGERRLTNGVLCGFCLSLALYSYPPMRVQAPLVMAGAVLVRIDWVRAAVAASSAVVFSLPLILKTLSGEIQGRFQVLSIFNESYVRNFGAPTPLLKLQLLWRSFQMHFSQLFLFTEGDRNLRHSTRMVGEWSALDLAGLLLLAVVLLARWRPTREPISRNRVILFCAWGYLCGILPAAMTWEGTPHALRAIGAWPFLSLLAGLGIAAFLDARPSPIAHATCLAIAVGFSAYFLSDYFLKYPERSKDWYDVASVETLKIPNGPGVIGYPDLPGRYFDLVYRHTDHCP